MQALQFGQTCEERKSRDNSKHPVGPPLSRGSWDLPGTIAKSGPARDGTCLGFTSLPDVQTGVRLCPSGLAVLKTIFECSWLPSPGGSRGRVRTSKLPFRLRDLVFRPTSARIRREEYIYTIFYEKKLFRTPFPDLSRNLSQNLSRTFPTILSQTFLGPFPKLGASILQPRRFGRAWRADLAGPL